MSVASTFRKIKHRQRCCRSGLHSNDRTADHLALPLLRTPEGEMRPPVTPFSWERVAIYFCLSVFLVFFLSPLYVILMTSFKSLDEIRESNLLLPPQSWFFGGWVKAWDQACVGLSCNGVKPHFLATFAITIPGLILAVLVGALNGYALTQWKFRGSDLLLGGLMMGCFMPFQLYLIPIAITLRELGIF